MARRWWQVSEDARKVGLGTFASSMAAAALGLGALADSPDPADPRAGRDPVERTGRPVGNGRAEGPVQLQILGVNDFHGRLESPLARPRPGTGVPVALGGAANLKAHLDRAQRSAPDRTIRVHAGDMVGASPLLSSHFHDEPTVRTMNALGFDVGTLGNHEFDEGGGELLRLLRGGRQTRGAGGSASPTSAADFEGVRFPYVAANVTDARGAVDLPGAVVIERAGARVGFIGVTTPSSPQFLLDRHDHRFTFGDISEAVDREAAELRRRGVEAIVVLAHSGAYETGHSTPIARGEIVDEAAEMTSAVDAVVAGHTHSNLNLRVPNARGGGEKLVVEAGSYGVAYDRIAMTVDRGSGEVLSMRADTPPTWADEVTPDASITRLIARYRRALGGLDERVVGTARSALTRGEPGDRTAALGRLAALAQRRAAKADLSFVNPGNLRADIDAGPITHGEVFAASAYEHPVLSLRMTGEGVRRVVAAQFAGAVPKLLHADGISWSGRGEEIRVTGEPLDAGRTYSVAVNELLAEQPAFGAFAAYGRGREVVGTDLEALLREVRRAGTVG